MPPADSLLILSGATLAAIGLVAGVAAWAWAGWLRLRDRELELLHGDSPDLPAIGQRIDLADLKERVRKLEAIAAGVDY